MSAKRYWSSPPVWKEVPSGLPPKLTAELQRILDASKNFDAQLSPSDIREMQTIDADCNDCAHFKRGAMRKAPGLTYFEGHCRKFESPAWAYPCNFTGHSCFEHRRAGEVLA